MISGAISQALPDNAFQSQLGTLYVIYADTDTIVITEIKLRDIAVKMPLFAMLIDAFHAALKNRKIALNGIGMHVVADPFIGLVADTLMAREMLVQSGISTAFRSSLRFLRQRFQ